MSLLFVPPAPVAPAHHPFVLNYPLFHYVGPKLNMSTFSIFLIEAIYGLAD